MANILKYVFFLFLCGSAYAAVTVTGPLTGNGNIADPLGCPTCITGSSSIVNSVSNSDGSLGFSPTTGAVVGSINLAHSNIFTTSETSTSWINSTCNSSSNFLKGDGSCDSNAYITLTSISGTSPISYNSSTGVFSCPTCATGSGFVNSFSSGTTGLTPSSATSGSVTLAGDLVVANGGTGLTSLTSNTIYKGNGTSAIAVSALTDDGTTVTSGENINIGSTNSYNIGSLNGLSFPPDSTAFGQSVAVGPGASASQIASSGTENVAVGNLALNAANSPFSSGNVAIGYAAASSATSPGQTVAIGAYALSTITSSGGGSDIALGYAAMGNTSSDGGSNTAIAARAQQNATGYQNSSFGFFSLESVSGSDNLGLGAQSANTLGSGNSNICIGDFSCLNANGKGFLDTMNYNVIIGDGAFSTTSGSIISGNGNVGIGYQVGVNISSGSQNVIIGYQVGQSIDVGSNDILIGNSSAVDALTSSTNNEINIGNLLYYNTTTTSAPAVSSCGTSPSIDSRANNRSGTVTVGTIAAASCTITFAGSGYSTWDHCRVTSQGIITSFAYAYSLTAITVTGTSLVGDKVDYDCDGY